MFTFRKLCTKSESCSHLAYESRGLTDFVNVPIAGSDPSLDGPWRWSKRLSQALDQRS
jgi:hypothetical protein